MNERSQSLWITMLQAALLGIVAGLGGYVLISIMIGATARAQGQRPPDFQGGPPPPFGGGFPGGGFPGGAERKLVAQFDKNGDKRLDAAERKAARAALNENPGFRGFGRPGRRGGPGGRMEPGTPGARLTLAAVKSYGNAPLYDLQTLRTIFLQFEDADWEQELAAFHNTDVEVPATVIVDGKTYTNVGVHFRGMSSFMMVPEGSKRSFNLSFDFADDQQQIGGYRTMNLLNANGDPTFVRAVLYSEIARQYIAAPKMNYVQVAVNGESWGVYVNAQQFNKDFTRDFFKSTKGARWKVPGSPGGRGGMEYLGDDPAAYKRTYDIKTKDDPKAWGDLIRMFRVLNQTPPEKLEAALSPLLDLDGALKFLALEVALVNSDGYWARASDYSIYQDEKGTFHVLPHDVNEGLAEEGGRGFGPRGGGIDLDPLVGIDDPNRALRSKLLAVPALRERYMTYVRDIARKWLDWQVLEPRVHEYQSLIADVVKADTRKLYSFDAFQNDVPRLKDFVDRRQAFLLK